MTNSVSWLNRKRKQTLNRIAMLVAKLQELEKQRDESMKKHIGTVKCLRKKKSSKPSYKTGSEKNA